MTNGNPASVTKLVLLIDGENLPAKYAAAVLEKVGELGVLAVARVYGHFANAKMSGWVKAIAEHRLTKVDVSQISRAKNSADFKLVIEAMDMLHSRQLDGFCIASSDGDFSALAERIRANALVLYGFGETKAPATYRKACDAFFDCAELATAMTAMAKAQAGRTPSHVASAPSAPVRAKPPPQKAASPKPATGKGAAVRKPAPAKRATTPAPASKKEPIPEAAILAALASAMKADGWASLSALGTYLRRANPDFSSKKYGHSSMMKLIKAMPKLETRVDPGNVVFVHRR
jgi:cell division septation protein DedD